MEERQQTQVLEALRALKAASKDIEANSDESGCSSPSMNALLELETGSDDLLSGDPKLTALSSLLSRLKTLASSLSSSPRRRPRLRDLLLRRPVGGGGGGEISRVAGSIGSELQSWIDRRSIDRLLSPSCSDEEKSTLLTALESRLSQGYDRSLQDLLLGSAVFSAVETLLSDPNSSKAVRERSAAAVLAFVRFNKDVFVGEVLMGPTVRSLVSMATATSLRVLNGLISSIRSPIVDLLHADGEIARIISILSPSSKFSDEVRALAFGTVLEIAYYGRKDAIDDMIGRGLVEELMELQRSEAVEAGGVRAGGGGGGAEASPFATCVSRLWVQMEVGEGLRQGERRELKLEVLRRVRAAAADDAEAAGVVAEVLWGSTCCCVQIGDLVISR